MDIEKIKTQMCDNYCKHFADIRATFEDIDRGQEELDRICEHCPLNELEDAGGEYIRVADLLKVEFKNPIGLTAFRNIIKRQDTVEILPCAECLHYKPLAILENGHICEVHNWQSKACDFCSFAERNENDR